MRIVAILALGLIGAAAIVGNHSPAPSEPRYAIKTINMRSPNGTEWAVELEALDSGVEVRPGLPRHPKR